MLSVALSSAYASVKDSSRFVCAAILFGESLNDCEEGRERRPGVSGQPDLKKGVSGVSYFIILDSANLYCSLLAKMQFYTVPMADSFEVSGERYICFCFSWVGLC